MTIRMIALALAAASSTAALAQREYSGATAPAPRQPLPSGDQKQAPPADAGFKIKPSPKALKAIVELQKAVNANDTATIPAKLAEANAAATTKEDKYLIAQFQLKAAAAGNDADSASKAIDAIAASGYLDSANVAGLYRGLGGSYFKAKQYDKAAAAYQRALAINPNDMQALPILAEAQDASGQHAQAIASFQKAINAQKVAGQKPSEDLYKRALNAAYTAKSPTALELGREWVAAYPTPDSWHNALAVYRIVGNPDPASALDIMRLARAAKAMEGTSDYNIYAAETINASNYGEAKAMLSEGIAAGKIKASDPVIAEIQKALNGKDVPSAADLASREAGAKVATAYMRIGDAYYGAGNYAKAADMYRQAVAKGAEANLANLRLGEALVLSGDRAGAAAALGKVGGSLTEVGKFWLVYVNGAA
jgi:tetratricopeptide (TPR) repeat protein